MLCSASLGKRHNSITFKSGPSMKLIIHINQSNPAQNWRASLCVEMWWGHDNSDEKADIYDKVKWF